MVLMYSARPSTPSAAIACGVGMVAEQRARGAIHALVGGLRGKHHGHQQLIGRGVLELAFRFRVRCCQSGKELANLFRAHAGTEAGGGWSCRRCSRRRALARASSQLRPAISSPRTKKAPGGRMAIRKPG
jgi:hypothetical protein